MKQRIPSILLLASVAFCGTAGASDASPPPPNGHSDSGTGSPEDWSKTYLQIEAGLKQQIQRTKAFLDDQAPEVDDEISRLKTEGHLDRRSTSTIRSALKNARDTMSGMTAELPSEKGIDGWDARMIAYELGMAADALAQQAEEIEVLPDGVAAGGEPPLEPDERRELARTLTETSERLRSTADAIMQNLR